MTSDNSHKLDKYLFIAKLSILILVLFLAYHDRVNRVEYMKIFSGGALAVCFDIGKNKVIKSKEKLD